MGADVTYHNSLIDGPTILNEYCKTVINKIRFE